MTTFSPFAFGLPKSQEVIENIEVKENKEGIWQDACLSDAMAHLLKSGHLTDINIHVGSNDANQQTFKCHKFVLASATPVFEAMFYGDFMEKNQKNITITDIEPEEFDAFLEYIYAGNAVTNFEKYSIENLKNFIYIGNKYLLPKFADFGYEGLEKALKVLRIVDIIELFHYASNRGFDKLITSVSQELGRRPFNISHFNQALISLNLKTFKDFIKCINGNYIRFNWIEEYVKQNKFQKTSVMELCHVTKKQKNGEEISTNPSKPENPDAQNWKILLETIDYQNMTIKQFSDGPGQSNLLTPTEKINILIKRSEFWENRNCKHCNREWH